VGSELLQDREGNTSSKRTISLLTAIVVIILSTIMGLVYIYGQLHDKNYDVTGIVAICGVLSGLITLLATIGGTTKT